ncbi:hypothetical protein C8R47DRAFT_1084623 [Mycena vitilis]|nr:hypothetical protein C8R47DRAFT_1084623 [Mycena vitilis]
MPLTRSEKKTRPAILRHHESGGDPEAEYIFGGLKFPVALHKIDVNPLRENPEGTCDGQKTALEYLVKWQDTEDCHWDLTWEPSHVFLNKDSVENFWREVDCDRDSRDFGLFRLLEEIARPSAEVKKVRPRPGPGHPSIGFIENPVMASDTTPNMGATRVYALWEENKCYYPGRVAAKIRDGVYTVKFDDENDCEVEVANMRLDQLRVGDKVEVSADQVVVARVEGDKVVAEQTRMKKDFPIPEEEIQRDWADRQVVETPVAVGFSLPTWT